MGPIKLAYGTGTTWMKETEDNLHRPTIDAIKLAIETGYRHLDGAQYYKTETELGVAIKESGVPRSELFISTKAVGHDDVEALLRDSLKKMGTDYVDLYLIHEPFSSPTDEGLQATWRGMEACLEKGLARNIGVSNFLVPHLQAVLKTAKVKPAVNQIELHPYLQRTELVAFLREQGIAVEAFAPLTPLVKAPRPGPVDGIVAATAARHRVSEGAVLLRWLVDQGAVVITTSSKRERLQEHLETVSSAAAFKLTAKEIAEIAEKGREMNFRQFFVDAYGEDNFL
ncbi:ketoreductase [Xylariales sp. PMI_506]|nr:ketoreductase [Xylariales sp. PMI_506]